MKFPEQFRFSFPEIESRDGDKFGVFRVPAKLARHRMLNIIADNGDETKWEHVSVSLPCSPYMCPSWEEMCLVKSLFWGDDECVVQFHPAKSDYVNIHTGVLHLWKQVGVEFVMPPKICV